jgi:hypothetical protein
LRVEPCGGIWAPRLEAEVIEQSCGVGTCVMCAGQQQQQQRQHQQKLSHLFGHVGR